MKFVRGLATGTDGGREPRSRAGAEPRAGSGLQRVQLRVKQEDLEPVRQGARAPPTAICPKGAPAHAHTDARRAGLATRARLGAQDGGQPGRRMAGAAFMHHAGRPRSSARGLRTDAGPVSPAAAENCRGTKTRSSTWATSGATESRSIRCAMHPSTCSERALARACAPMPPAGSSCAASTHRRLLLLAESAERAGRCWRSLCIPSARQAPSRARSDVVAAA